MRMRRGSHVFVSTYMLATMSPPARTLTVTSHSSLASNPASCPSVRARLSSTSATAAGFAHQPVLAHAASKDASWSSSCTTWVYPVWSVSHTSSAPAQCVDTYERSGPAASSVKLPWSCRSAHLTGSPRKTPVPQVIPVLATDGSSSRSDRRTCSITVSR